MAFIADVMSVDTARLAGLFLVADPAFHHLAQLEIFKPFLANQAFVIHGSSLFVRHVRQRVHRQGRALVGAALLERHVVHLRGQA